MKTDHQSHFPAPAQENRKLRTDYWLRERYFDFLCPSVALILFFSLWEGYVRLSGIQNYILPGPLEILQGLVEHRGKLVSHSLVTAFEMLLGYSCSIIFGSLFAFLVVRSSTLDKALMPLFFFSQTVSKIAIAPPLCHLVWVRHIAQGIGELPYFILSHFHLDQCGIEIC